MELFPAADEEQWQFIKRLIDDCDYYILVISGRYGSTTPEGASYTEKEYDYALERGLRVLAFVHNNPDDIPVGKSEKDPALAARLAAFRDKIKRGRLVKMWNKAEELPGLVALSLSKTIKSYPAVGWVRADKVASSEVLAETNELRKRNQELEAVVAQLSQQGTSPTIEGLAGLDDVVRIFGTSFHRGQKYRWDCPLTWGELFALIAPYLLIHPNDQYVEAVLKNAVWERSGDAGTTVALDDQVFQTAKIQLRALGLVNLNYTATTKGGMALFWSLTPKGEDLMMQMRTVKKSVLAPQPTANDQHQQLLDALLNNPRRTS